MPSIEWRESEEIHSRSYTCGYCGNPLASQRGWMAHMTGTNNLVAYLHLCHQCNRPTYFDTDKKQYPGPAFGGPVQSIPDKDVAELYEEARRSASAGCYTAVVLCCRKLLMHIAVAKGAKTGQDFLAYAKFLADNHFVPPDAAHWVDEIRTKGNEANHEIKIMAKDDAEELISFLEMLLKVIFEFPARVKKSHSP